MKTKSRALLTVLLFMGFLSNSQANTFGSTSAAREIQEYSKRIGCGNLSDRNAAEFARAVVANQLDVERFKKVYNVSCAFKESMEAVKDETVAIVFEQVLRMSKSSRCAGLTAPQAMQVTQAAIKGEIKVHEFSIAYHSSCSFDGPFAVAHLLMPTSPLDKSMSSQKPQVATRTKKPSKNSPVRSLARSPVRSKEDQELIDRWVEIEMRSASEAASSKVEMAE